MTEPFLGEIRIFSFGYAPRGWAFCNGQLLPINQNQALFSLLGTNYGGNGTTTFALPNLQGREPIHTGNGHTLGEVGGEAAHTVTVSELPVHTHSLVATSANADTNNPAGALLADSVIAQIYHDPDGTLSGLDPAELDNLGGSQPHLNLQPFLTLNFCIAMAGIFPSRD